MDCIYSTEILGEDGKGTGSYLNVCSKAGAGFHVINPNQSDLKSFSSVKAAIEWADNTAKSYSKEVAKSQVVSLNITRAEFSLIMVSLQGDRDYLVENYGHKPESVTYAESLSKLIEKLDASVGDISIAWRRLE